MKIYVYAIAKNEAKFVDGWVRSMSEADGVFVLDTGSTDGTADKLRSLGVTVKEHRFGDGEFRFDTARNESLAMVPEDADWCVCTDLDEEFSKGWRKRVEEVLSAHPEAVCAEYDYHHTTDKDGTVLYRFNNFKIHRPKVAKWQYYCHEVLVYDVPRVAVFINGITLFHHQDQSKPRSGFYLSLLKRGAEDAPEDARASHYYGRELMNNGLLDEAIAEFQRQLTIKGGWVKERAQAMRFIGRCFRRLEKANDAFYWYTKAVQEDGTQREAAMELAEYAAERGDWNVCAFAAKNALMVQEKCPIYITEEKNWSGLPFHLYSLGLDKKAEREFRKASVAASVACRMNPENKDFWRHMIDVNGQSPVYPPIAEEVKLMSEWFATPHQMNMPDWSIFDRIYCIHYLGNRNREEQMEREFSRVGLWGNPRFTVWETVRTVYEDQIPNQRECAGIRNLALQTLRILLTAKAKGYKRILIWEDDVCMLKDVGLMAEVFKHTPLAADLCVYDKMVFIHNPEFQKLHEVNRLNKYFAQWMDGIYSGSCYMVSETAYDTLIDIYSRNLIAPDDATQVKGLNKAYSIINTSCQVFHDGGMFAERFGGFNTKNGYAFQGLDYSHYNVPEGYGYDAPVDANECL